jgi:hypothetical protein
MVKEEDKFSDSILLNSNSVNKSPEGCSTLFLREFHREAGV